MKIIWRLFLLSTTAFFLGIFVDIPAIVIIFAFTTFVLGAAIIGIDRGDKNDETHEKDN